MLKSASVDCWVHCSIQASGINAMPWVAAQWFSGPCWLQRGIENCPQSPSDDKYYKPRSPVYMTLWLYRSLYELWCCWNSSSPLLFTRRMSFCVNCSLWQCGCYLSICCCSLCNGGGDSSVVRAPDSWLKGRGFESVSYTHLTLPTRRWVYI